MLSLQFQLNSARSAHIYQSVRSIVSHISPTTSLLRSNTTDNEVYLLGTAHVSDASSREVVDLIQLVNPEVVFVELDPRRAAMLRNRPDAGNDGFSQSGGMGLSSTDFTKFIQANPTLKAGLSNGNFANSPFQSLNNILKAFLGWFSTQGQEMKAAMHEADKIGARCVYGDIDFDETTSGLKAAVFAMMSSPAGIMKTMASIPPPPPELNELFEGLLRGKDVSQFVEEIKTRERAQLINSYSRRCFPDIHHVMTGKRDAHMARQLKEHCSRGKVVAVVGMAHVEGIIREWESLDSAIKAIR